MNASSDDVKLVFNGDSDHRSTLLSLSPSTQRFQCLTAFARRSGLRPIRKELLRGLRAGMKARFVIGLNFFQTEPAVLEELLKLSKRYALELYVSRPGTGEDSAWTFHPKVFTFEGASGTSVLVGSANLTGGGLGDNHEASVLVRKGEGLIRRVDRQVSEWMKEREIVLADAEIIGEYARQHAIHRVHANLARRRAVRAFETEEVQSLDTLEAILIEMKADRTSEGFRAQRKSRRECREGAHEVLGQLSETDPLSDKRFADLYDYLAGKFWHSGGLHRGKTAIARNPEDFRQTLRDLSDIPSMTTGEAFSVVHTGLANVPRAGINVMTEILHTYDNARYPVMNQNSVHGLTLAGYTEFPRQPNRGSVDAKVYARFCSIADTIRERLGLENFTELDAVFNYAYWSE